MLCTCRQGIDGASPAVQHYKSGILDNSSDCPLPPSHAVLVVGFSEDYWLIKNSWGTCKQISSAAACCLAIHVLTALAQGGGRRGTCGLRGTS